MSGFKLYADPLSPVCRSIMMLLATNQIPYELVKISLKDHETQTSEELRAVNPAKKVPAINDNGFCLFESTAILRYIAQKYKLADHWYPSDLQVRAKVDEALSWFPGNLRCGLFFNSAILPVRSGKPRNEEKVKELTVTLKKALDLIENYFLKDKKFIAGDEISIADLQFVGEITQYWISNCDIEKGYPRMKQWLEECQKIMAPHFEEASQIVYELRKSGVFNTTLDL